MSRLDAYAAIGCPVFGTRAIRAEVAERVHRALVNGEPAARLSSWGARRGRRRGCPAREAPGVPGAGGAAGGGVAAR
ncbi:hypothetical protein WME91_24195 [Sorangium sp. So ce269]